MKTLDQLKITWGAHQSNLQSVAGYEDGKLQKIISSRVRKHTNSSFQYFWASFTLQILVYGLLSNVLITHWGDPKIVLPCLLGVLMYMPFTFILLQRFKNMAATRPIDGEVSSLYEFTSKQKALLESFYAFKLRYEILLIPISSAIGVYLVFDLWAPGGVSRYWTAACIIFLVTLLSCTAAIIKENRNSFIRPLERLNALLDEFKENPKE
jgi:hypothetical protein